MMISKSEPGKRGSLLLWLSVHIVLFAFCLSFLSLIDFRLCPDLFYAAYMSLDVGGNSLPFLLRDSLLGGAFMGLCVSLWGLFLYRGVPGSVGRALSLLRVAVGCWMLGWAGFGLAAVALAWLLPGLGKGGLLLSPGGRGLTWWRADFVLGAGIGWLPGLAAYAVISWREVRGGRRSGARPG